MEPDILPYRNKRPCFTSDESKYCIHSIKYMSKDKRDLDHCFAREKEIVFAQQKQSVPMSINEFVEMTIFMCLICFSIYDKMQGFIDKSGLFIFYLFFFRFTQKFKMATKSGRKIIFVKSRQ